MRTFEIGYIAMDNSNHIDEHNVVRFTVMNSSFEKMATELIRLFNTYMKESGCDKYFIRYIDEVISDKIDDD